MVEQTVQFSSPISLTSRAKKLQLLVLLKRLTFSGQLTWRDAQGCQWLLFFAQGNVIYGTGGVHPMRRWYRQVQAHLPELDMSYHALQKMVVPHRRGPLPDCGEYRLLHHWFDQGKLSADAFQSICDHIITDILFDVVQAQGTQYQLTKNPTLGLPLTQRWVNETELANTVTDRWQAWVDNDLATYSPNLAPVIQQPEPIQAEVSPRVYQTLMQLLDGQRSLRDLAVKFGQEVLPLVQALQPYLKAGWISLVDIADYPAIVGSDGPSNGMSNGDRALIACIDDSPMVCKAMGPVIRAAGYGFLPITEGTKAIPTLLSQKPDMIFLDLVMPDTNGYEICENLRKISQFKHIPIVILSGNDGLVDQVRARLLGATDFLSKPMEPIVIISIIRKHLGHLHQH
ncbi:MAG: response regulator [Leptolyngbya sp. LCM1.Bin17]|nr:MAG: response regulator [Leptolyngbya sp. LCM1.Bin17]